MEKFATLNKEVDQLIAAGFVQDVTARIEKPKGFDHEFRVIGLTILGENLFSATQQEGVGRA